MYIVVAVALRIFAGFGLSVIIGVSCLFATWALYYFMDYLWPREVFVVLWFSIIGVGGGAGTAIAWYSSESSTMGKTAQVAGWVVLGVIGAWLAYYYKVVVDPNPASFTSREISSTAVVWATIGPNVVASAVGLYRHIRTGAI